MSPPARSLRGVRRRRRLSKPSHRDGGSRGKRTSWASAVTLSGWGAAGTIGVARGRWTSILPRRTPRRRATPSRPIERPPTGSSCRGAWCPAAKAPASTNSASAAESGMSRAQSPASRRPRRYGHPTRIPSWGDQHALGGAHITLIFEPNDSGETAVKVIAASHVDDRGTPIRHDPRGSSRPETADGTLEPPELGADEPPQRPA